MSSSAKIKTPAGEMAERSVKSSFEEAQFIRNSCAMHTEEEALNDRSSETDSEDYNCNLTTNGTFKKKICNVQDSKATLGIFFQFLVTGVVMVSSAGSGMPIGYSAILLPQLKSTNESLRINEEIGSWIASIHSAAAPFGALMSGVLIDSFGPKSALQIANIPLILGWILIALCENHGILLLGRFIAGMSVGLFAAPGQILLGEISDSRVRGVFSSVPLGSYSFGILLVYSLGALMHWRNVAAISTALPLISIILYFFLPESPVWLVRKKRMEKARKSAIWLRGGNINQANEDIDQIVERVKNSSIESHYMESTLSMFFKSQVLKPFIITNVFTTLQVSSGTYLIIFYAVDILSHTSGGNINEFHAAVLTAGVRFGFSIVACVILAFVGRRTIALSSGIGTAISAFCLGTYLYLEQRSGCSSTGYFAAICILLYVVFNTTGLMVLPGVMIGELYPARVRGLAGSLTFFLFNITIFSVAKIFPFMKGAIGIHGVFWFFGGSAFLASVFSYLMLPETKGKTLNEIEDYFMQKNILWITRDRKTGDHSENLKN